MAREVCVFGARGDGKSWTALWAMVMHAVEHHNAGFPLPTVWLGARDTFANHQLTTHKSLRGHAWDGRWTLKDGGHTAVFTLDGVEFVNLHLVGVDSPSDVERLRTECHGLWFDEAAPAMSVSLGLNEDAWDMALSSQRLETHKRVAVLTTNYPEDEHWTAQRFYYQPCPQGCVRTHERTEVGEPWHGGCAHRYWYRIPPGERASEEYRAELDRAYANRPDLRNRLLKGKFGAVILGEQVAVGFNEDVHVRPVSPEPGATVWIGQDGGLTPTSVIAQRIGPRVRVIGAISSEHDGIKQHVQGLLLPWLAEHAPWALANREALHVVYDPSMNTDGEGDTEANPLRIMRHLLTATYTPGPIPWVARREPMLALFNTLDHGEPALAVDPVRARGLVVALRGGWHYPTGQDGKVKRDEPVKNHPHSDYGDAFTYLLAGVRPTRAGEVRRPELAPRKSTLAHYGYGRVR